jgi:hypothetical protein
VGRWKTGSFFHGNPQCFGFIMIAFGAGMLWGAMKDRDWFFKSNAGRSFNTRKIDCIANFHGRGPARIQWGAGGMILAGVSWFWVFHYENGGASS